MRESEPYIPGSEPIQKPSPQERVANKERHQKRVAGFIPLLKDKT